MSSTNTNSDDDNRNDVGVYVLGGMDPQESAVFRSKRNDPSIRNNITDSENVMEILAQSSSVNPTPSLRPKILEKIIGNPLPSYVILSLRSKLKRSQRYVIAASVLFTISGSAAFYYYSEKNKAQIELYRVNNELTQHKLDNAVLASKATVLDKRLALLNNPSILEVSMKSVKRDISTTPPRTTVFWNSKENTVYLEVQSLPANNDSTDYQLWALVDGKPRSLGVFHSDNSPFVFRMNNADSADAFAITLEPKGGSPTPTLENLTVLGNTPKQLIQ